MSKKERPSRTLLKHQLKLPVTPTRRNQDFSSLLSNPIESLVLEVRKPNRQWYIRVHPTWNFYCYLFQDYTSQIIYLVAKHLYKDCPDVIQRKILFPAITLREDLLFFWSVNLGNRNNTYNRTAMEAVELAKTVWIRISSDDKSRSYKIHPSERQGIEPKFPSDDDLKKLVLRAFKGKTIEDKDHPVLKHLRGA